MKKNGFSLWLLIIGGVALGIGGIYGFKIGKPYMDTATAKAQAETVIKESMANPPTTETEFRQRLFNRLNIQGIDVKFENIKLQKSDGDIIGFDIDMSHEIPLWTDAYLVLELKAQYPEIKKEAKK